MGQIGNQKVTNKKRLPFDRRRILVKYYLQLEGWGPSQIAKAITNSEKIKVDRKTISDDLNVISAENDTWINNQAAIGWISKVRDMTTDTMTEEAQLKKTLDNHYQYYTILHLPISERPIHYDELLLSYVESKLSPKEVTSIQRALNDKRRLLMEISETQWLYQKTKRYVQFFNEHQSKTVQPDEK